MDAGRIKNPAKLAFFERCHPVLSWAPSALAQTDEMLLGAKRRTVAARRGNFRPVGGLYRRILIGAVRVPVRTAAEHAIIAGLHSAAVGGNDRQAHLQ